MDESGKPEMVHSLKHEHEKTAEGMYLPDLNILISSSVIQRGASSLRDNYTIGQRTIYHVLSDFRVNVRRK